MGARRGGGIRGRKAVGSGQGRTARGSRRLPASPQLASRPPPPHTPPTPSGLGLESARRLHDAGATVVVTARSVGKVARTVGAVKESSQSDAPVIGVELDLASLDDIKVSAGPSRNGNRCGFEWGFRPGSLWPEVNT